jgi:uncharacterized membrane protein
VRQSARATRIRLVDALRGLAIVQMIGFHLVYTLTQFGWVDVVLSSDPPWVAWRTAIVSQFLLIAGASLALRAEFKPAWRDFWRRWREVAAAALAVSFGSWLVLGPRMIYFGILHFIAVALVLGRLLLPLGSWNPALGIGAIVLGLAYASPAFDAPPANVLGFVTRLPYTEDYVPVFPWLGVVLIGSGLGIAWQRRGFPLGPALARVNESPPRVLTFLGSWPLTVYLTHVPVLAGIVWTLDKLLGLFG